MATSGSWDIQWESSTWGGYPKAYKWKGNFNRSGNVLNLTGMTLQIVMLQGTGYGTASDTVTITGQPAQTATFTMNGTSSNVVSLTDSNIAISSSTSSYVIECMIAGEVTGRTTINFDPASSGPSGLALANIVPLSNGFKATVSITAWNGGSDTSRYRELSVCPAQSIATRKWNVARGSTLSSEITVDDDSPYQTDPSFTIAPNSRYYLTMYATNGTQGVGNTNFTAVVTAPAPPTVELVSATDDSAIIGYTAAADGGIYDKTIEYSLDGGTIWITAATIIGGSATTGTFTITGLTAGEHTVLVRSRTTAGTDGSVSVTFNTAAVRLISSDGTTGREATRVLVSVDGIATEASRLLVSHNGIATENA